MLLYFCYYNVCNAWEFYFIIISFKSTSITNAFSNLLYLGKKRHKPSHSNSVTSLISIPKLLVHRINWTNFGKFSLDSAAAGVDVLTVQTIFGLSSRVDTVKLAQTVKETNNLCVITLNTSHRYSVYAYVAIILHVTLELQQPTAHTWIHFTCCHGKNVQKVWQCTHPQVNSAQTGPKSTPSHFSRVTIRIRARDS